MKEKGPTLNTMPGRCLGKFVQCEILHLSRTLGKVCHEGGIAVLAKGCGLEIVSVPSNERLAAATFAADPQVRLFDIENPYQYLFL